MAYTPPKQSGVGQIIDSILVLALLFVCLLLPFELKKRAAESPAPAPAEQPAEEQKAAEVTWESLKQNAVQAQQWEKLGKKPADAQGLIETKFDFDADLRSWKLPVVIVVIIGYFLLLLRISDREYKQVISERFGNSR